MIVRIGEASTGEMVPESNCADEKAESNCTFTNGIRKK